MACAGHMLSAFLLSACEPPAHRSAGHWPAAQAALPLEALPVEANCLQATLPAKALPSKAMCAVTRATYDPSVEVPRHLHRPARERVFIRMVIPAMRAQTCRAFLFVLPYGVDAQRVQ
jgi:hypothetical protein